MKTLITFMLLALAFAMSSYAAEPTTLTTLLEVQAALKKDLMSVKQIYMTKLKPETHADRIYGDGVKWVGVLADPVNMEIATGTVTSKMTNRAKFDKVIEALESGRNNAKLLGTPEGNKMAAAIDSVLKIIAELQKNPVANSRDWPAKAKDLLAYLQ